jgi:hypothetical protein
VEVRAQSGDFVCQHSVVFGERVSDNERVKHAKPADEQEHCRHRKKQNKPGGDGTWFICASCHVDRSETSSYFN